MPPTACNRAPQRKRRKGKEKTSRQSQSAIEATKGWKNPKRTSPPQKAKDATVVRTDNSYQLLATEEVEQYETKLDTPGFPEKWKPRESRSRPERRKRKTDKPALKVAGEDQTSGNPELTIELGNDQTGAQTNGTLLAADEAQDTGSYFFPGKLEGRPVQFLVDTGCTTNLLSKQVFDRLPERVKNCLEESDSHGIMADGTQLPFYGRLRLPLRVRDVKTEEVFVVSRINEDAILGMPFLVAHNCSMEFQLPIIQVDGQKLKCTDRHGRLLTSSVQVTRELVVPPRTEMTVPCRVTTRNFCPLGVIEGQADGLPIATSLNRPGAHGKVVARCLNLTGQPMRLKAGTTIGTFTGIEEKQVEDFQPPTHSETADIQVTQGIDEDEVPEHLKGLYEAAKSGCKEPSQSGQLARLLTKYSTVFSTGDGDVGRTTLVEHTIPIEEGTRPIRQPPHRLGPEKEAEAEKQVTELLEKGLIEPASGAWSSPVVLVRKKDQS